MLLSTHSFRWAYAAVRQYRNDGGALPRFMGEAQEYFGAQIRFRGDAHIKPAPFQLWGTETQFPVSIGRGP